MNQHSVPAQQGARPKPKRTFDCAYTYRAPNGHEVFQHVRWRTNGGRGKEFSYRWRSDPADPIWVWKKPTKATAGYDADDYLWQLPAVRQAVRAGDPVWWPEGERDALELGKAGVVATSHHGGAGKVYVEQCEWLRGARGVVLLADRDTAGAYDALQRWRGLVEHAGVPPRRIRVLRAFKGKDAADHLAAGYGLANFVPVSLTTLRRKADEYSEQTAAGNGYAYSTGLTVIKDGKEHRL